MEPNPAPPSSHGVGVAGFELRKACLAEVASVLGSRVVAGQLRAEFARPRSGSPKSDAPVTTSVTTRAANLLVDVGVGRRPGRPVGAGLSKSQIEGETRYEAAAGVRGGSCPGRERRSAAYATAVEAAGTT